MKLKVKRLTTILVGLLVIGAAGWGVYALAQGGAMAQQMEMMKQKMMNRPSAMKEADQAIQNQKKNAAPALTHRKKPSPASRVLCRKARLL